MPATKKLIQLEFEKFLGDGSVRVVNSDGTPVSQATALDSYKTNDIDDEWTATSITYLGKAKDDGTWAIQKIDETSAALPVFTYATTSNNPAVTTYDAAWSGRASLVYNKYEVAF